MDINIPESFNGKIHFFWNTEMNFFTCHHNNTLGESYLLLGSSDELEVKFKPKEEYREQLVSQLEAAKQIILAAANVKIEEIDGKIQSLLSLPHMSGDQDE